MAKRHKGRTISMSPTPEELQEARAITPSFENPAIAELEPQLNKADLHVLTNRNGNRILIMGAHDETDVELAQRIQTVFGISFTERNIGTKGTKIKALYQSNLPELSSSIFLKYIPTERDIRAHMSPHEIDRYIERELKVVLKNSRELD